MTTTSRLALDVPQSSENLSGYPAQASQALTILDNAAMVASTTFAAMTSAAHLLGKLWQTTDVKSLYWDDGTTRRVIATLAPARVYAGTGGSVGGSASFGALFPNTVSFDDEAALSGTGTYTCPRTGKYQVKGAVGIQVTTSTVAMASGIMRGGTVVSQGALISATGLTGTVSYASTVEDVLSCTAGDQLQLALYTANGGTIQAGTAVTYMAIAPLC
jgi:hypothetical protein